jgi:hypothetical protein
MNDFASAAPAEAAPQVHGSDERTPSVRRLDLSALTVSLPIFIVTFVGILQNEQNILPSINPLNWSFDKPFSKTACSLLLLTALLCFSAVHDHRQRRRRDQEHSDALIRLSKTEAARHVAQQRAEAFQTELISRTAIIEATVRSLPSRNLVPGFDEAVKNAHTSLLIVLRPPKGGRKNQHALEAVRYILFAAANLVKSFEKTPVEVLYTANVMIFRPASELTPAIEQELRAHMLADDLYVDLKTLRGVLELRPELTASTENTREIRPDRRIGKLVLPVPMRYSPQHGHLAFPGAPTAFCRKSMDVCPNVLDLPDRVELEGVLPKTHSDTMRTYFEERAQHIQSFISIPLFASHNINEPCGVVNINSNITGLLREKARQEAILPNLRALLWNLPEMIDELDKLQQQSRSVRSRSRSKKKDEGLK